MANERNSWPRDFLWGASTSSYQIEGAANEDGRGPSIWDTRSHTPGKIENGDTGDVACDHYHRWPEDVGLMRRLGIGAYRFSLAWPRLLPQGTGAANDKGLDFYDRLIDALLEARIEPWICLYHWDLPQALQDRGGWASRDAAGWFADYAALAASRYGDRVKRWATFNEFNVFTLFGYAIDWGAPGITDRAQHLQAIHHANLAHGEGVRALRDLVPGASIGGIHNRQRILPEKDSDADRQAAALLDEHWNLAFTEPQLRGAYPPLLARALEPYVQPGDLARIAARTDWLGLNHYGPIFARADPGWIWGYAWGEAPADAPRTEIGWPIFPEMFEQELVELTERYRLPIYVTENGCGGDDAPDAQGRVDDPKRITYLHAYVEAMRQAMMRGADVRGYFVWSLLDNFEWGSGYRNRFGIVHVDFASQKRTPKSSFDWYAELIRGGAHQARNS
ncbi:MAG: GH1 family beta-glucosidase [Reyranellaceae bacterium]